VKCSCRAGATANEKQVVYWRWRPPIREIVEFVVPVTSQSSQVK
jgi:hypothetical protein